MNLNDIGTQFYNAGVNYSAAIQPYALKLFSTLFLIDIIVTWIQYTAEGQLDPSFFLGRLIKHVLSGGFVYLMIINAFTWMNAVINSFSAIGAGVTGLPPLSPQTVLALGYSLAHTILNAPASASMITNLELAIVQSVTGLVVLFAFTITAAMLLFTLVEAYLMIGGGVILLAFGGNRFTATAAEGYFPFVIRVGVRLLFYYLVLAVGVQLATQWSSAIAATCNPVPSTLPWYSTYGVDPKSIVTTVCSGSIPVADMINYTIASVVFAILCIGIPHSVANLVGGSIGLSLAHAFEAAYTAQTVARIVNPITASLRKVSEGVASLGRGRDGLSGDPVQTAMQDILTRHQHEKSLEAGRLAATTVLNPFDGRPPGYNLRRPDGTAPTSAPGTRAIRGAASTSPISANFSGPQNGNGNSRA
jgi:P-type conjugative transfer protein TrbL